ncbi:ABC-type sugar transport system, permease component [Clostridium pasteurianum DSM 525 = ATCC 6013]|uniref:ABC-type sugar transport system, permease component n=1 Tax=Clostridium pasteurianum DSM 525 = ATCC 6013 TaxID=1262449 RepID=A0A0H3J2A5_CLOPA|nr:carbohydrate ABC transporter permease [Clostridium pasteurianum]AJA48051.1 ABC-type sugar transport system, permease component [Clostridium pasteurianum DSM 525 = ATCC 6013]AJA52039.1 ABC-type sugar transport system, permease component [Clostridium pasteurianum DSM 525 = ATCC 6013]AOZ75327.1 sugar ABC transporter permease [Clostridium pasteurianum DSM 525 = ATCC 6013]AOZ79122.1 sugar ABC transporter permease [Clostridium pasteurianum]ELP60794.1 Sugar permease [Clostridium pasteurianum DSM 5
MIKEVKENIFLKVSKYLILIVFAVCALLPVVYMLSSSFMDTGEVQQSLSNYSFHIVPNSFTLIQYYEVFLRSPEFLLKFWNSIILTLPTVLGQILISVLGAYAFAKINFPFNKPIFFMFILLMLMPYQVTLVPIYIILKKMNLVGSYASVILPGMFSTFGVFLLTQFIKSIPDEQCQSAKVDGANHIQILFKIILPQCKGAVASLAILSFLDNWNMIEQPLILLENTKQPMSIFLSQINETELRVAFAAGVLFMIPSILIFLKGEKQLLEGIQHLDLK